MQGNFCSHSDQPGSNFLSLDPDLDLIFLSFYLDRKERFPNLDVALVFVSF